MLAATLASPAVAAAKRAPAPVNPNPTGANGPAADFPVVVGAPYQIGTTTFTPTEAMNFDTVGYAAVGDQVGSSISAAHHTLPMPSYAEVTDLNTGRTILVRVERRGPMDSGHAIELTPAAAAQLGIAADGSAAVRVRRVNPPETERALLRGSQSVPERMATPKPLLDVLQRKLNPNVPQRALARSDDASPAVVAPVVAKPATKLAAAPKPTPKGLPVSPTSATPPRGYVPSVPAPGSSGASFAASGTVKDRFAHSGKPRFSDVPAVGAASAPHGSFNDAQTARGGAGANFREAFAVEATVHPATPHGVKPAVADPVAAKVAKPVAPHVVAPVVHDGAVASGAASGTIFVQAGAFSDHARAQQVASRIGGSLSKLGNVWRVRVGPFGSQSAAASALAKVKSAGYSEARIQRAE